MNTEQEIQALKRTQDNMQKGFSFLNREIDKLNYQYKILREKIEEIHQMCVLKR